MKKIMAGLLACGLLVPVARAGWEYMAVTKGDGNEQAAQANMTVKGLVEGAKARVEFINSSNPMMPSGAYVLSQNGGKTMYMVNPEQRAYSKWDMEAMMGFAGGAMQMMGIKFTQPKIEKIADEKGPALLGYPTRYYRFRTSYTMSMNFMGMRRSTETVQDEEIWSTDRLNDAGFNMWLNQKPQKTGNPELDKLIEAELSKAQGFPLKRITTTMQKESDGKTETSKMTFEVTSLAKKDVPPSTFELPKGYTEQPMFPGMVPPAADNEDEEESQPPPARGSGSSEDNPFLKFMQQMQKQSR